MSARLATWGGEGKHLHTKTSYSHYPQEESGSLRGGNSANAKANNAWRRRLEKGNLGRLLEMRRVQEEGGLIEEWAKFKGHKKRKAKKRTDRHWNCGDLVANRARAKERDKGRVQAPSLKKTLGKMSLRSQMTKLICRVEILGTEEKTAGLSRCAVDCAGQPRKRRTGERKRSK